MDVCVLSLCERWHAKPTPMVGIASATRLGVFHEVHTRARNEYTEYRSRQSTLEQPNLDTSGCAQEMQRYSPTHATLRKKALVTFRRSLLRAAVCVTILHIYGMRIDSLPAPPRYLALS